MMRKYFQFCVLIAILATAASGQITASGSGAVLPKTTPTPSSKPTDAEKLNIDFRNFSYEIAGAKPIALKNGSFSAIDPKTKIPASFEFRKVFYFDVTGDREPDAIVHLLGDNCEMCEEKNLFFIYSAIEGMAKPVFNVATGAGKTCGLSTARFDVDLVEIEVFGDCSVANGSIIPAAKPAKDVMTRFTFSFDPASQPKREQFPAPTEPRTSPRIRFGKLD